MTLKNILNKLYLLTKIEYPLLASYVTSILLLKNVSISEIAKSPAAFLYFTF